MRKPVVVKIFQVYCQGIPVVIGLPGWRWQRRWPWRWQWRWFWWHHVLSFQTSFLADMGESTTAHHWRLLLGIGLLLRTSHSRSQADAVFAHAPPTITLADWPLYPQLPASFLATVDKVVITSFNPRSYQSPQIHALLVTKHDRVYLYGNSPQLGLGRF